MNKSDLVVLGFLRRKPMYGYEMIQWVKDHHLDGWAEIKMPSIYKALQRLENSTHISGEKIIEGNNPPKIVYHITSKGNDYFIKLVRHYAKTEINPKDFWLAVSFMKKSFSQQEFVELIERRKECIKQHKEVQSQRHQKLKQQKDWRDIPFYLRVLMEMGQNIHDIDQQAMNKLFDESQKPENQKFFMEEDEK